MVLIAHYLACEPFSARSMPNLRFAKLSEHFFACLIVWLSVCFSLVACTPPNPTPASSPEIARLAPTQSLETSPTTTITPTSIPPEPMPTGTPTPTSTPSPTPTPNPTATKTPEPQPTQSPTSEPIPAQATTPTPINTFTPTSTPIPTDTPEPTHTPTAIPEPPTQTTTPSPTPTPTPTATILSTSEDDHSDRLEHATPTTIGEFTLGHISNISDVDLFGFNASAGNGYWIQVNSVNIFVYVKLRNSDGELIAEGFLDPRIGNTQLKWDAPDAGPYYVEITADGDGNYALVITDIDPVDDHGHDFASATQTEVGQSLDGRINWFRDVDYFQFDAERGIEYEIETQGFDHHQMRIYDSGGNLISSSETDFNSISKIVSTANAPYFVEFQSAHTTSAFTYSISIRRLGPFDHADDIAAATMLPPSQAIRGNIQPGGDVDFFTFETEADQIAIATLDYNIIGGMVLRLHDAEGRIIAEDSDWGSPREGQPFDFSEDEHIARRLPATGIYYVSVFSVSSNHLGYYQLSLELKSPSEYHGHAPVAGPIENASQFPSSFDAPGDYRQSATPVVVGERTPFMIHESVGIDTFKFEALEGQIYTVSTRGSHSNFGILALDPNGEVIAEANAYGVYGASTSFTTLLPGIYFVAVKAEDKAVVPNRDFSLVVQLDDHAGEIYSATPLTLGEEITAKGLDLDFFKFTAQKGTAYSIDIDKIDQYTHLALYTPDELILADLTGHDGRLPFRWRATSEGTHYLTILGVADYTLTVDAAEPDGRDDHGNDTQSATQLTVGQDIEGVIDVNGDIDIFKFTAEKDQPYVINLVSDPDKDQIIRHFVIFAATVELVNAEGISLLRSPTGRENWGYEARMLWEPPASGEYYLKVYPNWHASEVVGEYRLNVEVTNYEDQHADSINDATPLDVGETKHGSIGCHDDVDIFTFHAEPKTAYRVVLLKEYTPDIGIGVHDATGLYLGPRQYYKPNYGGPYAIDIPWQPAWQAPQCVDFQPNPEPDFVQELLVFAHQGGELFVDIDAGRRGHNRYSITIQEDDYRDDHGDRLATATDIRFGEAIDGELDLTGESDLFKFQAQEGQAFEFELSLDSLSSACLLLIERDDLASEEWCIRSSTSETGTRPEYLTAWVAPSNADFYLVVQSHSLGSYSLTVKPIDLQDDHSNVHDEATLVESSVPVQGRIDSSDDVDVFAIEAEDGDVIRLTLNHDALDQIDVDLYDTIARDYLWGTVEDVDYDLSQRDNAQTVQRIWRTVRAGTHYLVVKAVSLGQYSVNLTRAEYQDDFGNNPADAHVLSMDVEIEGEFEVIGDVDFFAFHAEVGEVYHMHLTSSTIDRPQFNLFDAERSRLNPYFGDEFQWQATSTGTFYVAAFVREFDQDIGTYKLVVNRLPDDDHGYDLQTATPLMLDSITHGAMSWPDDTDFFKFEASKGEQYLIDLDRGGGEGVAVVLLDPQGEQIAREIHIDDIIWTASVSATHYVAIEPAWNHVSYSVVVTLSDYVDDHGDSFENATRISVGESIDAAIAWRDTDYFRFDVEKGRSYHLELEKGTIHVSRMRVVDAEDARIEAQFSEIDDKTFRLSFEASYDGTLYAVVDPYRTRGTYTIRFGSSD